MDLVKTSRSQPTTGKVIAELKFVFWEQMLTVRHDARLWNVHLKNAFPNHEDHESVQDLRNRLFTDLEAVRRLRNRIAHHEPVIQRDLAFELARMVRVVSLHSTAVAAWMVANQAASHLIAQPLTFVGGGQWQPSHEEIQRQAYAIWLANQGQSDADANWQAARDLLQGTSS